jgi:hypothetical protein
VSDVTDSLQALAGGTASLDDVAGQFRQRQWPVQLASQSPADAVAADAADPEPEPDGGFGEVEAAFTAGTITHEQYATLAAAAAEGIANQMGTTDTGTTETADAADGAETKAGGPPITAGAFVKWSGGSGRVDMVVKSGSVPGVDKDVTGTASDPACRVTVWAKGDSGWSATDKKVGLKLSAVSRTFPLSSSKGGGTKDAALVGVLARHEERVTDAGLPGWSQPGARAVLAVYDRGQQAWPGETKTILAREDWALGRVDAFLDLAAGDGLPGYVRDIDLLPDGHPARGA